MREFFKTAIYFGLILIAAEITPWLCIAVSLAPLARYFYRRHLFRI